MLRAGITRAIFSARFDFQDRRGFLAYGLLFLLIWLIWWMAWLKHRAYCLLEAGQ
jgi:hypothetical protein